MARSGVGADTAVMWTAPGLPSAFKGESSQEQIFTSPFQGQHGPPDAEIQAEFQDVRLLCPTAGEMPSVKPPSTWC